eukprot:TRINITY_DN96226_c0_g1_i1.p1 TRINITY_DN96226_c0_g1~~TRINITY_DN96226_c0_g1_i1.p1  ORF type:complete len:138 (-),score=32.33 TRINITY_DN96226_c0_g1_i1:46-459(-)
MASRWQHYCVLRRGLADCKSYMNGPQTVMFECGVLKMALEYLEWFYSSDTVKAMAEGLGFTSLPGSIATAVILSMVSGVYRKDAETDEARLAKKHKQKILKSLVKHSLTVARSANPSCAGNESGNDNDDGDMQPASS